VSKTPAPKSGSPIPAHFTQLENGGSLMDKLENLLETLSSDREYEKRFAIAKVSRSCIWCGNEAQEFRDASARLEYFVSALCQKCQDEFINGGEL
jgi:hypothetical protein